VDCRFESIGNDAVVDTAIVTISRDKNELDVLQEVMVVSGHAFQ